MLVALLLRTSREDSPRLSLRSRLLAAASPVVRLVAAASLSSLTRRSCT